MPKDMRELLAIINGHMHTGRCPTAGCLGECAAIDIYDEVGGVRRYQAEIYIWDRSFNDSTAVAKWFHDQGATGVWVSHVLHSDINETRNGVETDGVRHWSVLFEMRGIDFMVLPPKLAASIFDAQVTVKKLHEECVQISADSKNSNHTENFIQEFEEGSLGLPFISCFVRDLYEAYEAWCTYNGLNSETIINFSREVNRHKKIYRKPACRVPDPDKPEEANLPPKDLRQRAVFVIGEPPKSYQTVWISNQVAEFRSALKTFLFHSAHRKKTNSDAYFQRLIVRRNSRLEGKDIPPALIDITRNIIKFKRLIKEK